MNAYQPRTDDMAFILSDVLQAPARLQALPAFAEVDPELMRQVLDEAGKFVGEVVAPLNRDGDEIGARFDAGSVTMPPGFRDAYQAFWQAGWPALACAVEDGGQGLPAVLEATLYEMLSAANHGWTMAPGLLHGAYECIKHHASDALKARYLEKMATGEWLATMCLTEPHAGSDLGLCRTKAVPQSDGSYQLQRHQDLHLRRRARPDRQHRAPGAGAPARRAARPQGPVAVSGAQGVLPTATAARWSASASRKRWACTAARPA